MVQCRQTVIPAGIPHSIGTFPDSFRVSLNPEAKDGNNERIPVNWMSASGASSYLLAALPPSLAVVLDDMTHYFFS